MDAIGALSTAELAKSIGVEPQSSSSSNSRKGGKVSTNNVKTATTSLSNNNTERGSKKELNSAGSSASLDTGSGSDSEGVIDVAHKQAASLGSSGSGKSGSSSSSSSSGGSSSGDNSPSSSSSSSAGSSGSEAMGPVRIMSTTESSSASGASSGGGSSSDGNDGLSSTALTRFTAGKGQSGGGGEESSSKSGLDGWRANLEQRRARGRLTETEKKARERAILALSLNFPSAASATSSSSTTSSNGIQPLFAIISLAGKQFKVSPGDIVIADRLKNVAVATELALSPHIVGSPTTTIVGRPVVQGATVMCVVESHELDEKVIVFKKKRRKRYQRTQGHRREISRIRIDKIVCDVAAY